MFEPHCFEKYSHSGGGTLYESYITNINTEKIASEKKRSKNKKTTVRNNIDVMVKHALNIRRINYARAGVKRTRQLVYNTCKK